MSCIAVVGSRSLPSSWSSRVDSVVACLLARGRFVGSGGAVGADLFALRSLVLLREGIVHRADRKRDRGTLFLDEIGDLSYNAQATLLRFLQEGEVMPIGSTRTVKPDVRVVSATNKDLERAMEAGDFREDLYERLNVFPLEVPPLRRRPDDIPLLVAHFVEKCNREYDRNVLGFTPKAMARFRAHPWKRNVRELENVIHRAVLLCRGKRRLCVKDVPDLADRADISIPFSTKRRALV